MDLEKLIFKAGEAKFSPPLPEKGIPKQWLPSFIRLPLQILFLPFILLDLSMQKLARILVQPPYKQVGSCKKRGNCCYYILLRKAKGPLGWLFTFWNTQVNGFYRRSQELFEYEGHKVEVMGCRHLKKDGSCNQYHLRPITCRKWPMIAHFGHPRILKGCGFKALPKKKKRKKKDPLSIIDP